jgi:hypothetical protein
MKKIFQFSFVLGVILALVFIPNNISNATDPHILFYPFLYFNRVLNVVFATYKRPQCGHFDCTNV